jgi:hypothetical protein
MYVNIDVPEIADYPKGFPSFWMKTIFGGKLSQKYQVNALINTYIRLTEAALTEYRLGAQKLREFWDDHASFNIGAISRSVSHFESCLFDVYRATNCFRRLRGHNDPISRMLNTEKPAFATDAAFKELRILRNGITHVEELVMKGKVKEGEPIGLLPTGPEVPHPTEPNQTIKTVDRLVIGSRQVLFSDLAKSLREMAHVAQKIATSPSTNSAGSAPPNSA